MFSLVKSTCACCFEEHDCVYCIHCAKSKSFYCKKCILDYNKANNTVGVCPTCKAHYGKQNCYYIYGTNIIPVLNTQIDKYRERIQSSREYQLYRMFDQLKTDAEFNICSKRSALLQLYLNRLYVDQHPTQKESLQTWAKIPTEAESILDIFDELRMAWSDFNVAHPDKQLAETVIRINEDFKHIEWDLGEPVSDRMIDSLVYIREMENRRETLKSTVYRNITPHRVQIEVTEYPYAPSNEEKGIIKSAVKLNQLIKLNKKYIPETVEKPRLKDYDLSEFEHVSTVPMEAINKSLINMREDLHTDSIHTGRFVAFTIAIRITPIILYPIIADIRNSISTTDYIDELKYYHVLSINFIDYLNRTIKECHDNGTEIDNTFYTLMHASLSVKSYTERVMNQTESDIRMKNAILTNLLEMVQSELFNRNTFLTQLDAYYSLAGDSFTEDLRPIIDSIKQQIFNDPAVAESFNQSVRDKLTLANQSSSKSTRDIQHVVLPETITLNYAQLLAKRATSYKLSFVRCVCGGSVIANVTGDKTVYECTRCHKQLDALPEQETDPETLKLLESISKRCPVCGTFIQKAEGCNHMFCTNCKNGFNWNDLSKLDNRNNTNPHFLEHRHGSSSNLRTLLDDYDRPAQRNYEPIEWFGNILFTDMNASEKKLNEHRETISQRYKEFINDDRFALKFVNELNINKMRIAFIQNTFDKMMARAFEVIQKNQREHGNHYTIRNNHKRLVTELSTEYNNGKDMIEAILNALNLSIDYAITMATNLSHGIEEESYDIPQEMEDEAEQMEQEILKQIAERAQSVQPAKDIIVIGDHKVSVRRG